MGGGCSDDPTETPPPPRSRRSPRGPPKRGVIRVRSRPSRRRSGLRTVGMADRRAGRGRVARERRAEASRRPTTDCGSSGFPRKFHRSSTALLGQLSDSSKSRGHGPYDSTFSARQPVADRIRVPAFAAQRQHHPPARETRAAASVVNPRDRRRRGGGPAGASARGALGRGWRDGTAGGPAPRRVSPPAPDRPARAGRSALRPPQEDRMGLQASSQEGQAGVTPPRGRSRTWAQPIQ
jgi:hypothetical protein